MTDTEERPEPPRLIEPPRLRTDEDRTATRLELFFDLAYVLVVGELSTAFAKDLTWHGLLVFSALFTVTWWSWVTTTLYANRFDTNDVPYKLAKLGLTFAIVVMAAAASRATAGDAAYFVAAYVATRVVLLVLYARAYRHVPDARPTMRFYLAGAVAGAGLWSMSLLFSGPPMYVLWALGVLCEAFAPLLATRFGGSIPLHEEHLPERFGLFAILVLGESIASTVVSLHDTDWRLMSFVMAVVVFVVTAALWWSYFELGAAAANQRLIDEDSQSNSSHDRFVYGHLPVVMGLTAVGIGVEQFILHPGDGLSAAGRLILCGGTAVFLIGVALVMAGTARRWSAAWPWPTLAIPVVAGIGFAGGLPPMVTAVTLAVVLIFVVITGIRAQSR
ncbi:low temperature requirement protein A [Mycolicibacterium stellerae]|uniref:low temperature requirement protein A n=1 Tax=Mycolicibacterium stellerae TaxID=2358193 RepID=UPI001F2334E2|nr:low temperature requirement protein A [Mycolicibacterium stellerae]